MPLEAASRAKLDRICDKLDLQPSDHVLEIGTGWGGFALHAAQTHGCRVTTTTLSREQRDLALERVREAGLADRVTILLDDYRELTGTYDKLVSIEMIEAVGWKDFGTFFDRCASLLRPDGVMALQAITIDDRLYDVEKAQRSFMNSLIFPNGCLPSVEVIARNVARHSDLRMVDLEDITPHYAETLRRWRANVEAHARAAGADGLRRALPAALAALSELLRGGLHRAPHRQRADRAGQAALARAPGDRGGARDALDGLGGGRMRSAADRRPRVPRRLWCGALFAAPRRSPSPGSGRVDDAAKVALRGLGGREIAVHGLAIAAAVRDRPLAPWLLASIAGDLNDIAATFIGRKGIPDGASAKTAAVAGGSAALTAAVPRRAT